LAPGARPDSGVYTFSLRQSSDCSSGTSGEGASGRVCAQPGAQAVAASGSLQGAGGAGGAQRRSPTGGAAKGMPRKRAARSGSPEVFTQAPTTGPSASATEGGGRSETTLRSHQGAGAARAEAASAAPSTARAALC